MPFSTDNEVSVDFQELLEDQWKALAGGFFQREHLDEGVIQQEVSAVAFKGAVRKIIIEEGIVLAAGEVHFVRSKVQEPLQNTKGLVLVQKSQLAKVAELSDEAIDALKQRARGPVDLGFNQRQ